MRLMPIVRHSFDRVCVRVSANPDLFTFLCFFPLVWTVFFLFVGNVSIQLSVFSYRLPLLKSRAPRLVEESFFCVCSIRGKYRNETIVFLRYKCADNFYFG